MRDAFKSSIETINSLGKWKYNNTVTTLLQHCHNIVKTLSQNCYNTVAMLSQHCHNSVTTLSQCCQNTVTALSKHCHNAVKTLSQHYHNAGDEGKKKLLLSKYLTLPHLLDTHLTSIFIFKIFIMCPPTFPLCSDWWITKVYSANVHKTSPVLHQLREVLTQKKKCEISHMGGGGLDKCWFF